MLSEGTFDGQVAVITGGGSGMGRAMAVEFGRLGAAVVVAGRRPEPLAETVALVERAGGRGAAQPTDVRVPEQVDALVEAAVERFGRVDVLVNDAAGNFVVRAEDLSPNGWRAVTSIVLDGGFLCARAAGRQMIAQGGGGAILSVIASYAWTGGPGTVHSAAAKAGLVAMTRTLAVEWAQHGIRVNTICPGPTATEGAGAALWPTPADEARVAATVPAGRLAGVEEIAWWATALCSRYAGYITGENLVIDGGHWLEQEGYMPALAAAGAVTGFDPVALETIEAEAVADAFGTAAVRVAGAVCAVRPDVDEVGINRVIGLGVTEPATAVDLDRVAAVYGPVRHSIALAPCAQPPELAAMLAERGYEPGYAWVKFHRPADPAPEARTELRVERIGLERAGQFTAVLGTGFELAPDVTAMLEHLPGRPGWGWYLAFDGELAMACGAVFVRGDHAWLGQAATLPEHRRRGGQSAITAARIAAASAAGASVVVTETGAVGDGGPGSSYRNILRAGFEPAYVRPNHLAPPPGAPRCQARANTP